MQRAALDGTLHELAVAAAVLRRPLGGGGAEAGGEAGRLMEVAFHELSEARAACDLAVRQWPSPGDGGGGGRNDCDGDLGEARELWAEAVREREREEARLWKLKDKRAGLLSRLRDSGEQQRTNAEARRCADDSQEDRESQLQAEIAELEAMTKAGQGFLYNLSDQLSDKGHLGVLLSRRRREMQHKHAASSAQTDNSREILGLQEQTEQHLLETWATCAKLELAVAAAHRDCDERTEQLRAEWAERQAWFECHESELEATIEEKRRAYAERWEAAEREFQLRFDDRVVQGNEARVALERQVQHLDSERVSEAAARRAHAETQEASLVEAKAEAMAELEAVLADKRQAIQAHVEAERSRLGKLRRQQLKRYSEMSREIRECKSNIQQVRDNYRGSTAVVAEDGILPGVQLPALLPPRSARMHSKDSGDTLRPMSSLRGSP